MKKSITILALLAFICLGLQAQNRHFTKITVASWNIGHFALGKSGDTKLTHAVLDFYKQTYRAYFNDLNADILALVEYNPLMDDEAHGTGIWCVETVKRICNL